MFNYLFRFAQLSNCQEGVTDSDRLLDSSTKCATTLPQIGADQGSLTTILNIVFGTVTGVAVLIVVIQGIRFVLSQGDPEKSASARKGVIYAVVGLGIVFLADVAVAFLLSGRFF